MPFKELNNRKTHCFIGEIKTFEMVLLIWLPLAGNLSLILLPRRNLLTGKKKRSSGVQRMITALSFSSAKRMLVVAHTTNHTLKLYRLFAKKRGHLKRSALNQLLPLEKIKCRSKILIDLHLILRRKEVCMVTRHFSGYKEELSNSALLLFRRINMACEIIVINLGR